MTGPLFADPYLYSEYIVAYVKYCEAANLPNDPGLALIKETHLPTIFRQTIAQFTKTGPSLVRVPCCYLLKANQVGYAGGP